MKIEGQQPHVSGYVCEHARRTEWGSDLAWCSLCGALLLATEGNAHREELAKIAANSVGVTLEPDGWIALVPMRDGIVRPAPPAEKEGGN